ncbi:6-phosphogluconolactonase (cycloisomerase 2 family) [Granulicella aggregans]|uniref:6-phosphogluconolactonase (Cycloisomerase 2 family) n=2 Tax=Granulicella aggregans TaxID=474949 RepID=A0A7W8E2F1_9BACT|nr:6-phosphogluconolactonase (cycloisomerase 2 family) [Granulicella aggregans]
MTSCGGGTVGFMWVLGTQYNQIGGFKIDNFTGNLTGTVGSPYSSGGTNPVMLALKSGGRYLYVLNGGNSTTAGNIALFSVGGDGVLSYQQSYSSQGTSPVWIATDSTGNYLFVLDQKAPDYNADATKGTIDLNGSITAFSLDPNTGRPSLITNAQVKDANGTQLTYFEVGNHPTQMRASSSCIYTLDSGDQTIFPYALSSSNGQLTQPTNSTLALPTTNATSVNVNGSYIYVTDAGSTTGGTGTILPYTAGSNCSLSTVNTGSVPNLSGASYPFQTISTTDNFLYVLNHSTQNTNFTNSSVSAFNIISNGSLTPVGDNLNPYSVGSGPVCMAIDPTAQYLYTSDSASNTVTGKRISHKTGALSALDRGSTFPTVGSPTCFVISSFTGY